MGWGYGNLGGSGGLNFEVKAFASADALPQSARENTIAVVTDTPISSWVMSAEQPAGAEGMVWIEVATVSDVAFYADKKQQVKVYPVSVSQYIDGAWASLDAFIYQNAAWVAFASAFDGWLYYMGEQYVDITGGWVQANGTLTVNEDSLALCGISSTNHGYAATTKQINTTGFSTLEMVVKTASAQAAYIGLGTSQMEYSAKTSVANAGSAYKTYTVPLDETQGKYYVMFSTAATSAGGMLYVNSVRLY